MSDQLPLPTENTFAVITKSLIFNDGQVLMLRRSKTAPRRALEWDFPGGFVDEGESPDEATIRELEEEAGLNADLAVFHTDFRHRDGRNVLFLFYHGDTSTKDVKLSYEHDKSLWVSVDKAIELQKHDIQIGALRAYRRLQDN